MLALTTGHNTTPEQTMRMEAWMEEALKTGRAPSRIPLPPPPTDAVSRRRAVMTEASSAGTAPAPTSDRQSASYAVPYSRSPKSPSPGTMNLCSFRWLSMAGV